ncbi:MAG: MgtC/SapB family protein [Oscillospiraceae bacterium]|nr:MgtC/SapB family protein [Oscillospiraceae bacterium]
MGAVFPYLRELNFCSMCLRVALAMLLGGFLGLDREMHGRPAGFRTYMLVSMAAACTTILSQYLNLMLDTFWKDAFDIVGGRTDLVRLGAQVVAGIGFLGTGTILVTQRREVTGLTTACCLWAAGCMGLAIGAGFYECVLIGFVLVACSMLLLPLLEKRLLQRSRNMNLFVVLDGVEDLSGVVEYVKSDSILIYDVEMGKEEKGGVGYVTGLLSLHMPEHRNHTEVLAKLGTLKGVAAIEEV